MIESLHILVVVVWEVVRKCIEEQSIQGAILSRMTRANNFMAWVRGPKADYDNWAELVGDPWWRWESVLPVLNEV